MVFYWGINDTDKCLGSDAEGQAVKVADQERLLKILRRQKNRLAPKVLGDGFALLLKFLIRKTDYRFVYHFNKKDYKGKQFILLGDHAARNIYTYTISGSPDVHMNTLVGFHNMFSLVGFTLLRPLGVIPKKLYEEDVSAMRKMLWVMRRGGRLCLFPEGIQSASGSTMPMVPGTIEFLKKAGVDVILCKSYGAYLCSPRYRSDLANGPMEFHYEILFNASELKEKSAEELYEKYLERFSYNDFAWNRTARNRYIFAGGSAKGIEGLLYHCPKCHSEFNIYGDGNDIVCGKCGNRILLNEYYDLVPYDGCVCEFESIDQWFKYQRNLVREEIRDENFAVSYEAEFRTLHYDRLYRNQEYTAGSGMVTINHEGIHYVGTKSGENVDILYDIGRIPSFTFMPGRDNDIYYKGEYILFRPVKDRNRTVKYMLYVEELHNLIDTRWERVSRDVYGRHRS